MPTKEPSWGLVIFSRSMTHLMGLLLLLFSHYIRSDSLGPYKLQRLRLLCLPLSPEVCSDSSLLSWWCYLTISSSATVFFCIQSFPASGFFQWIASLHQVAKILEFHFKETESVFPMKVQGWFPVGLTGFILLSKGLLRVFSSTKIQKH